MDLVVAFVAKHGVERARTGEDTVVAGPTGNEVVVLVVEDVVVAFAAEEMVVTLAAVDLVVTGSP